jgi:hypothetical protein
MSASVTAAPARSSSGRFPSALAAMALVVILAVAFAIVALNGNKAAPAATNIDDFTTRSGITVPDNYQAPHDEYKKTRSGITVPDNYQAPHDIDNMTRSGVTVPDNYQAPHDIDNMTRSGVTVPDDYQAPHDDYVTTPAAPRHAGPRAQ